MTHSAFASRPPRLHRLEGPLGGVAAGLGSTFGISANLIRLALAGLTILVGLTVPTAYLVLWFIMPEDPAIPDDRSPGRPPLALVVLLAVLYLAGTVLNIAFGLLSLAMSLMPLALVVLAVVGIVALWRRSSRKEHAVR